MNTTVNIVCYQWKTLSNQEHPLMIRVCKNGKTKYKSLGLSVHPDNWDFQTNRPKPKCPNRELILKIMLEKEVEFQKEILELASMQKEYTASSLIAAKQHHRMRLLLSLIVFLKLKEQILEKIHERL